MPHRLALLLTILTAAAPAFGYGVTHNAGLRSVEKISSTELHVRFGPAIRPAAVTPNDAWMFQVVSATDPDFQGEVRAKAAVMTKTEPDGPFPSGYEGPKFNRHELKVTLPSDKPLKEGHRYWLQVNSSAIAAFNRRGKWIVPAGKTPPDELKPRYGLREIYQLAPNVLHVITGSGVDVRKLNQKGAVLVRSKDDPAYGNGLAPKDIARRSNLDFYIPDGWPWQANQRHELFLFMDKPLQQGRTYTVDFNAAAAPLTCGQSTLDLRIDDTQTLNLGIKVNQVGYLPGAKKYGYLGMWTGSKNAYDFGPAAKRFEVRDAKTHAVALEGAPKLRMKATYKLEGGKLSPDPKQVKGPEQFYKQDFSYEDVYEMDLSALNKPGAYYLTVPGMGRSFEFNVGEDVYAGPFKTIMSGILHQRSGLELKEPYAVTYQVAGHRNTTEYSTQRHGGLANEKFATDGKKHDIWGGHYDAGDWNPRSHIDVGEMLLLLYDLNPEAFTDGQLNVPEKGNGLPDLLDEAHWALDLWTRLQDDDGGVHHGIEATRDPLPGDTPHTERVREFAFAKDSAGSYRFAANAAHASVLWRKFKKDARADELLQRALKAWDWGQANPEKDQKRIQAEKDQGAFAAAMLLRATGEARFDAAFKKYSVFPGNPKAEPYKWQRWDQLLSGYYYATCEKADPALKQQIVKAYEGMSYFWKGQAATTKYRYMRSPSAPNTWGTGGLPVWSWQMAMVERMTGQKQLAAELREWLLYTNDFTLGCHPLNLVFTVGLGDRYVVHAFHHLQCNAPVAMIPGLQCEGPGGRFAAGTSGGKSMGDWPGMPMYPHGDWPDLYKFSEQASPGMSEGIVINQAKTALAYGLFLPPAK